jgi:small subunit ribosomal protein S21
MNIYFQNKEQQMASVSLKPGETFESLVKRFKKAVERSNIINDCKKHEAFEKPSVKKRRKIIAAKKRAIKKQRKVDKYIAYADANKNFKRTNNQNRGGRR